MTSGDMELSYSPFRRPLTHFTQILRSCRLIHCECYIGAPNCVDLVTVLHHLTLRATKKVLLVPNIPPESSQNSQDYSILWFCIQGIIQLVEVLHEVGAATPEVQSIREAGKLFEECSSMLNDRLNFSSDSADLCSNIGIYVSIICLGGLIKLEDKQLILTHNQLAQLVKLNEASFKSM